MICDTAWHELNVGRKSMADAMLDARQDGGSYRRIEVITGQRQRRRWTAQTMLREICSPPGQLRGEIEIEVSGARIRVEPGVDLTTLSTVLSALRGGA